MTANNFRAFDLFEFVRASREAAGDVALSELPRVISEVPADAPEQNALLCWRACGINQAVLAANCSAKTEPLLEMVIKGAIWLTCQRCLAAYRQPLDVKARYRIVATDADADADAEALIDDDECDALVGSHCFDLFELIDEELLLSLPLVPKHQVCPSVHEALASGAAGMDVKGETEMPKRTDKRNLFAALGALKNRLNKSEPDETDD